MSKKSKPMPTLKQTNNTTTKGRIVLASGYALE
jgi:hypothetical protein